MLAERYSLVTVAFKDDLGFMGMQARSIARYVPRDFLAEIIVVANEPPAMPERWQDRLRQAYGPHADLVRVVPAALIATIPDDISGWFSQQVLKLTVARIVTARHYLVLDAKNHFIFPLTAAHIEKDGKPRMFARSYATHPLRKYLERTLNYFDLPQENIGRMLPSTPPFYIDAMLASEMMQAIGKREGRSFESVFFDPPIKFTEFFILAAYMLSKGHRFEDFYDLGGRGYAMIWDQNAGDDAAIAHEIVNSESRELPIFSVHRRALPLLTEASRHALAGLWQRRGLFSAETDALRYLADPNGDCIR